MGMVNGNECMSLCFQMGDTESNSFLLRSQHTQRKILYFVKRKNGELSKKRVTLDSW